MHSKIHELNFHEKQAAIYSITYTSEFILTGGADMKILVWTHSFEFVMDLTRHQLPVMILKPLNDNYFISASDDAHCIVWQRSEDPEQVFVPCHSFMKSNTIADICVIEPHLIIATISTIFIYNYQDQIHKIDYSGKLIQGVCLDPLENIITVQLSDGGIRHLVPKSQKKYNEIKVSRMCVGDFNRMIFRKCQWLPDGSGCLAVAGYAPTQLDNHSSNCCLLFSRSYLENPICTYSTPLKQVTCVVVYPIPLKLKTKTRSVLGLPYRYIFAALSTDGLQLWDTEHLKPIFTAKGFHYAHLTDAVFIPTVQHQWSTNSSTCANIRLLVTSADGFISEFVFEPHEFGESYTVGEEAWMAKPKKAWDVKPFDGLRFKSVKSEKLVMQIKKKNEKGEMIVIQ